MLNTHKPVTTGILGQTQQTAATTGLLAQRKRMASERTAMARRMKEVLPSTSSSTATPSTTPPKEPAPPTTTDPTMYELAVDEYGASHDLPRPPPPLLFLEGRCVPVRCTSRTSAAIMYTQAAAAKAMMPQWRSRCVGMYTLQSPRSVQSFTPCQ